jgi:Protein of unknown function (DUF5818)
MERRTRLLTIAVVVLLSPIVWAQSSNPGPVNPDLPGDVLGPQLVAWSQLQTPHPVPQPLPSERPDPQQKPAPTDPQGKEAQPATQSFTGTIMKDGGKLVLKTSDNAVYQIDDQETAKSYEGKRVKISGTLDAKTNMLHILAIDSLS